MSPRRRTVSGLTFSAWRRGNATRAVGHYKKRTSPSSGSHKSPSTSASLMRLRNRAMRTVNTMKQYNNAILARNTARIEKMLKEIANYNARHLHRFVIQPNMSISFGRRSPPRK